VHNDTLERISSLVSVPLSQSNFTYAYVPLDTVLTLMSGLGRQDVPFSWNRTFLQGADQVPDGIDMSTIGLVGAWPDNGVGTYRRNGLVLSNDLDLAQSFYTYTIDQGDSGGGWVVLDIIMIRLNTTYTPNGSFAVYSQDGQ
jgi:hypothetical protein